MTMSSCFVRAGLVTESQALLSDVKVGERNVAALCAAVDAALAEGRVGDYVELRRELPYHLRFSH